MSLSTSASLLTSVSTKVNRLLASKGLHGRAAVGPSTAADTVIGVQERDGVWHQHPLFVRLELRMCVRYASLDLDGVK